MKQQVLPSSLHVTLAHDVSHSPIKQPPAPRRRKVRFNDFAQQVTTFEPVDVDQHSYLWYNRRDFSVFRQETQWQAAQLHADNPRTAALLHVYRAFRAENPCPHDVWRVIQWTSQHVQFDQAETIGLDALSIPDIAQDFAVRRQHLLAQVHRMQRDGTADPDAVAQMIFETSRLTSRVARLYAGYVAKMALEEEELTNYWV